MRGDLETAFSCVPRHLVRRVIDLKQQLLSLPENSPEQGNAAWALEEAQNELIEAAIDDIS